tara:strand:+ start:2324 stop:3952 length:1629 start_codon:yes stop_codon:yes gene_type:complete
MPLNTPFLYLTFPEVSTGGIGVTVTSWNDFSGHDRHGAPHQTAGSVQSPGKIGSYSFHVNALQAPLYVPAMDSEWAAMSTITIAYWAKCSIFQGANSYVIGKSGTNVGVHDYQGWSLGNGVSFTAISNGRSASGAPSSDWHHYAFTYDGTTMRSYFDGLEIDSALLAGGVVGGTLNTDYCVIGGANAALPGGGVEWPGQIDQVIIWDEALNGTDISTLYNGGSGMALSTSPKTGLDTIRTYFRFENNYSDSSGNSYNSATTTGDPTFVSSTLAGGTAAVDFDGDDYVYNDLYAVGIDPWVKSNVFTVSLWIKTSDPIAIGWPKKAFIAHLRDTTPPDGLGWTLWNDDKWWIPQRNGAGVGSNLWVSVDAGINPDGLWHHHVLTFDGQTLHSYVDGASHSDISCRGARIINSSPVAGYPQGVAPYKNLGIGYENRSAAGIDPCIAEIDEIAIFNEALQPADVSLLYNGGAGRDVTPVTPTPPLPVIPIQDAATDRKDYIIVSTDVAQISRQYDRTVPYVPFSRVIKGPATLRGVVTAYTASRG